ncbi:hypothetical protein [Cupriavidus sp. IDO]|uniref:hypothetical protein n=1 Tax=Cupriavidus sp. IDO TaxID=1539142 RepID=UPI0005792C12|nr:hypothetical protein [Cupriavidus sp. IDO]KWR88536.1 hypothetical protein RM96_19270 [Cupriavidus sp. IDO]
MDIYAAKIRKYMAEAGHYGCRHRADRGEEPQGRLAESLRPVPDRDHGRGGAGEPDDQRPADVAVFVNRDGACAVVLCSLAFLKGMTAARPVWAARCSNFSPLAYMGEGIKQSSPSNC